MITEITNFIITYIQTAPVNFTVVLVCSYIAMKIFNWTWKHIARLIIIYILLTIFGQMYGIRVPTYIEVFDYLRKLGDWIIDLFNSKKIL